MFSELGQIWTQTFRKTEPTDTHEYIRQHELNKDKGGKHPERRESDIFEEEDNAIVSVNALYAFLRSILQNHPDATKKPSLLQAAKEIQTPKAHKREPKGLKLRGAVNAYEHAAATVENNKSYEITEEQSQELNLTDAEIEDIRILIQNIEILQNYHIETIEISKGSSFLQSLKIAVETALPSSIS